MSTANFPLNKILLAVCEREYGVVKEPSVEINGEAEGLKVGGGPESKVPFVKSI